MCFCANCKFLNKNKKTEIKDELDYIPYFYYYCEKSKSYSVYITVSIKKDGVLNWERDSEEVQLNQKGCSGFEKKTKEKEYEQLTLF